MNNASNEPKQYLVGIVAIIVIAFMIYIWFNQRKRQLVNYQNYQNYQLDGIPNWDISNFDNKQQHFQLFDNHLPMRKINTESAVLGSHNSSHGSTIIASPYNPL